MKRLLVGILCGMLAIGTFAGCGGAKTADDVKENIETASDETEYTEIEWPTMGLAQLLPVPKSNMGYIRFDNDSNVSIDIANFTIDDYSEYVNECIEKGFMENYSKSDTNYFADGNGCHISITYDADKQVMTAYIKQNDNETSDQATINETANSTDTSSINQPTDSTGIRPEVKEFLDSYESFMNEYADFMEKYNNSNDVASMMKDYTTYMTKYADFTQKYEDLGDDDLNDEELKYYVDVQSRVTKRLIDVTN